MKHYFDIVQGILSILLIGSILLQQRGEGLGSAFGGSEQFYGTRRGVEKILFIATVVIAVLFLAVAMARIII